MYATKISAAVQDLETQAEKARKLASRESDPSMVDALLETAERRAYEAELFGELLREKLASAVEEGRHHGLVALDQVPEYGSAEEAVESYEQNLIDTFDRDPLALDYALQAFREVTGVVGLAEEIAVVDGPVLRRVERAEAPSLACALDVGALSHDAASHWYDLPPHGRADAMRLAWDIANL